MRRAGVVCQVSVSIWPNGGGFEQNVSAKECNWSAEEPIALLVDQLAALGDRRLGGGLAAGEAVGADEGVLLAALAGRARDRSGELILAALQIGLGSDEEALVLDLLRRRFLVAARISPAEQGFQERQRGCSMGRNQPLIVHSFRKVTRFPASGKVTSIRLGLSRAGAQRAVPP